MKSHKKLNIFFRFIIIAVLALNCWVRMIVPSYAVNQKDDNQSSEVKISWDEFKTLLKIDADEVKLSWDEFKKLLTQTGSEVKVEYNIQNGMVVLGREQFKKLLDQMKPPDVTPLIPPSDYLITKAEYAGVMGKESTTFKVKFHLEIFKKERTAYPKIKLLPQNVALQSVKLDNMSALVMNEGGWFVLATEKTGQHIIDLEFSIKSELDKGPDVLNISIPQTAITLLKLNIPIKDAKIDIPQAKHIEVVETAGRTNIDAVLSSTNQIEVKIHRAFVVKKEEKAPAKVYAESMNLFSIEDDALRVSTKFKLNVLQNTITNIKMYMPNGYSVLYVRDQSGQEIRDWTTTKVKDKEILAVPFESEKEGTVIFTVVSEKIFSEKENAVEFDGFKVIDAIRETGYVGAEKKSTAEAEIVKTDNIDRIDLQELPYDLVNMSQKPLIFGLRYLRNPFLLTLKITKHEELPTVNTVIDNASVMSVLLEEGKVITRVVYTVRNTWKQFLQLKLPKDAEIWSLYVNGKRELPSKNKDGRFMIPLIRSKVEGENIAPFDIEILYYDKTKKFGIGGGRKLLFPTADVVISRMLWSCYLPSDYRFIHFGGNVEKEKIASGIRPLLGQRRVFTYDKVNGYNRALQSWDGSNKRRDGGKLGEIQKNLQSDFRTNSVGEQGAFLNQLKQEIGFAQNIQNEQRQGIIAKGGAGVALLKIEVPTSGQLYRFAKTIVEGEDLYLNFQYIKGWMGLIVKLMVLFIVGYIFYRLRLKIKKIYGIAKDWIVLRKDLWEKLKSPQGTKIILGSGAVIFLFVSKLLLIIFIILLLIAWLKPEWIFKGSNKTS